jgi:hypothetical protein
LRRHQDALVARPRLVLNRSSGLTRFRHDGTVILTSVVRDSFRRELVHRDDRLSRDENLPRVATALDRVLQQVRGDGWPLTARTVLLLISRQPSCARHSGSCGLSAIARRCTRSVSSYSPRAK